MFSATLCGVTGYGGLRTFAQHHRAEGLGHPGDGRVAGQRIWALLVVVRHWGGAAGPTRLAGANEPPQEEVWEPKKEPAREGPS